MHTFTIWFWIGKREMIQSFTTRAANLDDAESLLICEHGGMNCGAHGIKVERDGQPYKTYHDAYQ